MEMNLSISVWNWDTNDQHSLMGGILIPLGSKEIDTVDRKMYALEAKFVRKTTIYCLSAGKLPPS